MDQPQEPYESDSDSSDSTQSTIEYERLIAPKTEAEVENVCKYIISVKVAFGANSEEYKEFLQSVQDFKHGRTDMNGLRSRIKLLCEEHPELVAGFNTFLPAGQEISMPVQKDYSVSNAVGIEETVGFVDKVKVEYMHDERRYKSFLDILNGYWSTEKSIDEVHEEVCILFHDRPYLVRDFRRLLFAPSNSMTTKAVHQMKLKRLSKKLKKSRILFYSIVFFLVLSLVVAFGLGISLGFYLMGS